MDEQRAILIARRRVLEIVEHPEGTLESRLEKAARDIQMLAAWIAKWVDTTAVQYRSMGYELEEWRDDIVSWLANNQFYIDDVGNDMIMRCHLSQVGWGRQVILTFRLMSQVKKPN